MSEHTSSVHIEKVTPAYWRVTLDNPPLNLFDGAMTAGLKALIEQLDGDDRVAVVVFDSAVPDFFMAHLDLAEAEDLDLAPGPTGLSPWPDVALRLQQAPYITVASVRGRARGVGSEFVQAMDIRFASREKAILGQLEAGCGLFPGGGGMERLPRLVGRSRAIEIMVSADDYDADTAELYGWINRAIPDAQLDDYVDRFARRVASFERPAIATIKELVNQRTGLPSVGDLEQSQQRFFELLSGEAAQARVADLFQRGLQQVGSLELNMGEELGQPAATPVA